MSHLSDLVNSLRIHPATAVPRRLLAHAPRLRAMLKIALGIEPPVAAMPVTGQPSNFPAAPNILIDPAFARKLSEIDVALATTEHAPVPELFADIPLDIFGYLLLERPAAYPNIRVWAPAMPSDDLQTTWVGSHGVPLLLQSVQFVRAIVRASEHHGEKHIRDATVLDFGFGWGRLLRLLYKYVPDSRLYGYDAWGSIIDIARELGLRGNLGQIDEYPQDLPAGPQFDLVYAFSVFTHLSEKAHLAALGAIRKSIAPGGVLVVTVRPANFWARHADSERLVQAHREHGFAFVGQTPPSANGDVPYGDTSVSLEYVRKRWSAWRLVDLEYNLIDPQQIVLILKPA
jgi:hypothetical protein